MRNTIIGFLVISAVIFGASTTYAQCGTCFKNYFSTYDEFKGSDAVFVGKVVEVRRVEGTKTTEVNTNTDYYEFDVKFRVNTAWKTHLTETITVRNVDTDSSAFKKGESYLVYARVRYDKVLRANIGCCNRTKRLSEAAEDLQEFKAKGEKPTKINKAPTSN